MCSKLDILVNEYGFMHMCDVGLSNGRLFFSDVRKGQYSFIIYAIVINNTLVYIGKTKDFYKRIDTYKNAKYWKNAHQSNISKTKALETAVSLHKPIDIYYRRYVAFDKYQSKVILNEESLFIKLLQPDWNSHYCDSKTNLWIP